MFIILYSRNSLHCSRLTPKPLLFLFMYYMLYMISCAKYLWHLRDALRRIEYLVIIKQKPFQFRLIRSHDLQLQTNISPILRNEFEMRSMFAICKRTSEKSLTNKSRKVRCQHPNQPLPLLNCTSLPLQPARFTVLLSCPLI